MDLEASEVAAALVGTERARAEACRRVGRDASAVAPVARDLGVGWHAATAAVADHGRPLVDDPDRLGAVAALGLDETAFLAATPRHPTTFVTGFVDGAGPACSTSCRGARPRRCAPGSAPGRRAGSAAASRRWPWTPTGATPTAC